MKRDHRIDGEADQCKIKEKLDISWQILIVQKNRAELNVKLYGLKACDTCRRAAKALEEAGNDVQRVDIRKEPVTVAQLEHWLSVFGDALINRRSATWRALSEAQRSMPSVELLDAFPAIMKRPVIESDANLTLGWDKDVVRRHLGNRD